MDRWHGRHESIIDVCGYHRITEKCQSADGTILIDESSPKSVTYCATDVFWSKHVVFLLFLSDLSIR